MVHVERTNLFFTRSLAYETRNIVARYDANELPL